MALFGPTYASDPDERRGTLDHFELDSRLSEWDERFYDLEADTDADASLDAYLDANLI